MDIASETAPIVGAGPNRTYAAIRTLNGAGIAPKENFPSSTQDLASKAIDGQSADFIHAFTKADETTKQSLQQYVDSLRR